MMVTHREAPFLRVPATLDHQQHQLYLRNKRVKAHRPAKCNQSILRNFYTFNVHFQIYLKLEYKPDVLTECVP